MFVYAVQHSDHVIDIQTVDTQVIQIIQHFIVYIQFVAFESVGALRLLCLESVWPLCLFEIIILCRRRSGSPQTHIVSHFPSDLSANLSLYLSDQRCIQSQALVHVRQVVRVGLSRFAAATAAQPSIDRVDKAVQHKGTKHKHA